MKTLGIRSYAKIANKAAERAKDKRPIYATVKRVDGVRVDLQVGMSKTILKNVEVIGDTSQVAIGDTVQIAWWAQDRPVAIAGADLSGANARLDALESRVGAIHTSRPTSTPNPTGGIADWQILRFSGGALASVHDPSESGMQDALDVSSPNDLILLPAITLTMDFTVPPGVNVTGLSRNSSIICGTIILSSGSIIEKLRVEDDAVGVTGSATSIVHDCEVVVCAASGDVVGVSVTGGTVTIRSSSVNAGSTSGTGYGISVTSGRADVYETIVYGSTDQFSGTVHVHGTTLGEAVCGLSGDDPGELVIASIGLSFDPQMLDWQAGQTAFGISSFSVLDSLALDDGSSVGANDHPTAYAGAVDGSTLYIVHNRRPSFQLDPTGYSIPLEGGEAASFTLDPEGYCYQPLFCTGDAGTTYAVYTRNPDLSTTNLHIAKYTGGARTELLETDYQAVVDGAYTYSIFGRPYMVRVKTGTMDKIVVPTLWWRHSSSMYVFRIFTIDTASGALTDSGFLTASPILGSSVIIAGKPLAYGDKLILQMEGADADDSPFPTFIFEPATQTLTKASAYTGLPTFAGGVDNGMDWTNGIYYLKLDRSTLPRTTLLKIDMTGGTYTTELVWTSATRYNGLIQGRNTPSIINDDGTDYTIYQLADQTLIGSLAADDTYLNQVAPYPHADEVRQVFWSVYFTGSTAAVLRGLPMAGGDTFDIPITFPSDPFQYAYGKAVNGFVLFNGKLMLYLTSRSTSSTSGSYSGQSDIVILQGA